MNGLNNGPSGPTSDQLPERPGKGRSASLCEGFKVNALPFPSAQPSHLRGFGLHGLLTTETLERVAKVVHR
jgi:hypothetical protein